MKSARELYEDSVSYANLRSAFAQIMKQHNELETKLADLTYEHEQLTRRYYVRGQEIQRLNERLAKSQP